MALERRDFRTRLGMCREGFGAEGLVNENKARYVQGWLFGWSVNFVFL